ncbi:MAG: hypothetical protein Q4E49_06235 [Bacteroidales bacterium]|nr:hypothetical protein [Bacteroidales bacterium]
MDAFKDTDLREALRRIYSDPPQLPAEFAQQLHEAALKQQRSRKVRRLIFWPSIAAAACIAIAFLLGNGVTNPPNLESQVTNIKHQTSDIERQTNTAPIAVGTPPEREETASTTQDMVNKIKEKKNYFASIEEEQPTVQGAPEVVSVLNETQNDLSSCAKEVEQCTEVAFEEVTGVAKQARMDLNAIFELFEEIEQDTKKSIKNIYSDETELL